VASEAFNDAALVVLGHGTTRKPDSAAPVRQHAAELRRRRIFAEVREAFWKQEPQIKTVLPALAARRIFIVPLFISEGYFSDELIPGELGFAGHSALRTPRCTLYYCRPVGTHDSMTRVVLDRAREVIAQSPTPCALKPGDITLFLAGHGTERNERSRQAIDRQVDRLRARRLYAGVHAVFMEEEPPIAACYDLTTTRDLVVVPFFISNGLHVTGDIPMLLGEPERVVRERLALNQPAWRNPTERQGRRVWYAAAVGTDPLVADVILERVREAAALPVRETTK
jgi:sirohydrochlorin cobaltochelatase